MVITCQYSAEERIFPMNNGYVFTCMSFHEQFTEEAFNELLCDAARQIPQMADEEKDAHDNTKFPLEAMTQGVKGKLIWEGPPYLALICPHYPTCSAVEEKRAEAIVYVLQEMHRHQFSFLIIPRVLFQAIELLPYVRIVRSILATHSVN
jgi:hypothetical protein